MGDNLFSGLGSVNLQLLCLGNVGFKVKLCFKFSNGDCFFNPRFGGKFNSCHAFSLANSRANVNYLLPFRGQARAFRNYVTRYFSHGCGCFASGRVKRWGGKKELFTTLDHHTLATLHFGCRLRPCRIGKLQELFKVGQRANRGFSHSSRTTFTLNAWGDRRPNAINRGCASEDASQIAPQVQPLFILKGFRGQRSKLPFSRLALQVSSHILAFSSTFLQTKGAFFVKCALCKRPFAQNGIG